MLAAGVALDCVTAAAFAAGINATELVTAGAGADPGVFPSAGVLAAGGAGVASADPGVFPSAGVLAAGWAGVASAVVIAGAGGDPGVFPSAGVLAAGAVPASAGGATVPGLHVVAGAGAVPCSVLPASSRGGVFGEPAGEGTDREAGWVAASQIHGLPGTRRRGKQSGAGILSSFPFMLVNKYVSPLESKM